MGRKGWMSIAVIAFIVYVAAVAFWTFPNVEKKLNNQALELESVKQMEGAMLEWNGRDGYLIVPADIDKDIAENAASDVEDIQGVRNVKIIYDESLITEMEKVEKMPGKFRLEWTKDTKDINGQLDEDSINQVSDIFGVDGLTVDDKYALGEKVLTSLDALGTDVFDELSEGAIDVDGDKISLSGVLSETADIDTLNEKWGNIDGISLDLSEIEADDNAEETVEETEQVQTDINQMLEFQNVLFTTNSYIILDDSRKVVEDIAQILLEHEDIDVDIIGHTDSNGEADWNMELSKARANAVMELLIKNGVDASRMTASGMGEENPIDTNKTIEGRKANRRVEIIVRGNS